MDRLEAATIRANEIMNTLLEAGFDITGNKMTYKCISK